MCQHLVLLSVGDPVRARVDLPLDDVSVLPPDELPVVFPDEPPAEFPEVDCDVPVAISVILYLILNPSKVSLSSVVNLTIRRSVSVIIS